MSCSNNRTYNGSSYVPMDTPAVPVQAFANPAARQISPRWTEMAETPPTTTYTAPLVDYSQDYTQSYNQNNLQSYQAPAASGMAGPAVTGRNLSPVDMQIPETLEDYVYLPGFLRTHIGDLVRVEFLMANNTTDRVGVLREVGASYIVLDALEGQSQIVCDLYSIKFVTIINSQLEQALLAGGSI